MKGHFATTALLMLAHAATALASTPVSPQEAARWKRWLIPLPKQITIASQVTLPAADVKLTLRQGAGKTEQQAAKELRALFKDKAGADLATGNFEIVMGVAVADVSQLKALPNKEQAYLIQPVGDSRLVLTALDARGVYYAAQTLRQLLESKFADGKVTIPLAQVVDWPDLAERGEWGGSANKDVAWMASMKMNLVETHVSLGMKDGRGVAQISQEAIDFARARALKLVPIITHLNGLERTGIYDAYPELRGQGSHARYAGHKNLVAPCCSNPKLAEIFADWMASLAAHEGVTDVCAWLSELAGQYCSCEKCSASKLSQYARETQLLVQGWRLARKRQPHLRLRILLTQGSYKTNDQVLALIPPEVGVTYYDGSRTYDSSREPMIYPLLEAYAAKGRWLGCYPQITASWRIVSPWSAPQFIRTRMNEFVDKGLQCLCAYATPNNKLYEFNFTAAAEWSWNAKGRDDRAFAAAWATRKGLNDPDAAAEWAVTLGPVGWDVYGSRIPYHNFFGRAAAMVNGRAKPKLGERRGMFWYFPTVAHMDDDLAACAKAMAIAKGLDEPLLIEETRVIEGYVKMVKAIYRIADRVSQRKRMAYGERVALQRDMVALAKAGIQTTDSLKAWERLIGKGIGGRRFLDTVDATEKTVVGIATSLESLGIRNPVKGYMRREVGKWTSTDFDKTPRIKKTFSLGDDLAGPGTYQVRLDYTTGWNGIRGYSAALASAPKGDRNTLTTISMDKHDASVGYRSKGNVYTLVLKSYDPALDYYLIVDIRGTSNIGRPKNRQDCNGVVSIRGVRPANFMAQWDKLMPLSDKELGAAMGPKFKGKGLRVGVVAGGYGGDGILAALKKVKGIDAQRMHMPTEEVMKQCQVIIVPQPKAIAAMSDEMVKQFEAYVRAGGGLIATHNAVGYRGFPALLSEVCAKGLDHVRDSNWIATAEHPVTKGIQLNAPLPHSYFDHIELQAGPKGKVLAVASESKRPVVIAGQVGQGRYIACGLALGLLTDSEDVPPKGAELALLVNAVKWCGGK